MDEHVFSSSPRKKLKMDDNSSLPLVMNEDKLSMQSQNNKEEPIVHETQFTKEAEVGITEFISPELPGFTGILKKRSDSLHIDFLKLSLIASVDTPISLSMKYFRLVK